jgi:hypothetical protein
MEEAQARATRPRKAPEKFEGGDLSEKEQPKARNARSLSNSKPPAITKGKSSTRGGRAKGHSKIVQARNEASYNLSDATEPSHDTSDVEVEELHSSHPASPESTPFEAPLPKVQARIHVKKDTNDLKLAKSISMEVPDEYTEFKAKIEKIVATNARVSIDDHMFDAEIDGPTIRLLCTWKTRTLPGGKRLPAVSEFVELVDADDYEGLISEIRASHLIQKNGIEKNCIWIIGRVITKPSTNSESSRREGQQRAIPTEDDEETDDDGDEELDFSTGSSKRKV